MKLYKLSQDVNNDYDTFDSAIVAAKDADEARNIHPTGNPDAWRNAHRSWFDWCKPEKVKIEYIGEAASNVDAGVVCASFNAG